MQEESRFENVLKSFRVRKGKLWTQERTVELISEIVDVSLRTYKSWEMGERIPSPEYMKAIVAVFGLSQEDEDTLYRGVAQVPPRIHNLPFAPNPLFTGRQKQLEQLGNLLKEGSTCISGLGGIGKTQIALEYAHRCYQQGVYRAVFWVDAAGKATIEASYLSLAHLLDLSQKNEADTRQVIQAVRQWLETHTAWLLIMDNADDLGLARSFLPVVHQGHIILTTQSQIVGKFAKQIAVQEMEPGESLRFLLRRAKVLQDDGSLDDVTADARKAASQLVTLLGAHPLALDQAGAYIEETGVSFDEYTKLFRERRNYLMHRQGTLEGEHSDHPGSVATTIVMSAKKANERHNMAAAILIFCALLQPDAIPEELFQFHLAFQQDTIALHEGIATLLRYSLVKRNLSEKTYSIHRLVQAVVVDMFQPESQKRWKYWIMWAIGTALPRNVLNFKNWRIYERLLPHALLCITWEDVDIRGIHDLLWRVALYLGTRGRLTEAEPLLARTLAVTERHYGPDHSETAGALKNLADFYIQHYDREEEGRRMLERGLAILEKNPGNDPLAVSRILSSLSQLHEKHGEYEKAERLKLRVLTEMEQHWGADHPDVAKYLGTLAEFYIEQGKDEQAMPLLRRARETFDRLIAAGKADAEDPYIHLSLAGTVMLLHHQGRHKEAEEYNLQVMRAKERLLGPAHPDVIADKKVSISFLPKLGMYAEAEALKAEIRALESDE